MSYFLVISPASQAGEKDSLMHFMDETIIFPFQGAWSLLPSSQELHAVRWGGSLIKSALREHFHSLLSLQTILCLVVYVLLLLKRLLAYSLRDPLNKSTPSLSHLYFIPSAQRLLIFQLFINIPKGIINYNIQHEACLRKSISVILLNLVNQVINLENFSSLFVKKKRHTVV